ncbi:MAG: serine hydrolase domain-containing protein [Gemmatimonadota bacterium]|nr:serine hydrolase domain-containing protein [Gemmatimonadota bacterium]
MTARSRGTVAAFAMLAVCATPASAQIPEPTAGEIDRLVREWVDANNVVGLQVAIGIDDDVAWASAYGMADLENDIPLSNESRFRTASISKWMTATAALALVEAGRLDLDAPVQQYCRAYPEKRWPLTTRELLRHRGGVRHYWGANGENPQTPEERRALREKQEDADRWSTVRYDNTVAPIGRFADDSLLFEPGTAFQYTSFGYRLVGCVMRGAAGRPYNELMDELIFEPAGMTLTRDDDAWAIIPGRVRGYVRSAGGELRRSRFRDVSENLPAGGHVSTASDLVRFALAWNAGRLIGPESMAAQTDVPPDGVQESYYGFGVSVAVVDEIGGKRVHLHSGSQAETRTWLVLRPDSGIAISTVSNDEDLPLMLEIIWPILNLLEPR